MDEREGGVYTLIGGDFNARTGEGEGMEGGGDGRGRRRKEGKESRRMGR